MRPPDCWPHIGTTHLGYRNTAISHRWDRYRETKDLQFCITPAIIRPGESASWGYLRWNRIWWPHFCSRPVPQRESPGLDRRRWRRTGSCCRWGWRCSPLGCLRVPDRWPQTCTGFPSLWNPGNQWGQCQGQSGRFPQRSCPRPPSRGCFPVAPPWRPATAQGHTGWPRRWSTAGCWSSRR